MSNNLKKVQAKTREIHYKNVFKNLDMTIFFYFKSLKKQYLFSISQKRGAAKLVQNKTNYKRKKKSIFLKYFFIQITLQILPNKQINSTKKERSTLCHRISEPCCWKKTRICSKRRGSGIFKSFRKIKIDEEKKIYLVQREQVVPWACFGCFTECQSSVAERKWEMSRWDHQVFMSKPKKWDFSAQGGRIFQMPWKRRQE